MAKIISEVEKVLCCIVALSASKQIRAVQAMNERTLLTAQISLIYVVVFRRVTDITLSYIH